MIRTDAANWCNSKIGQGMDFDGWYGNQCVDFSNFYVQALGLNVFGGAFTWTVGYAYQLFDAANDANFYKVVNNLSDPNQTPSQGDIVILNSNWAGGAGHVQIFDSADASGYWCWEQNWGGQYVEHRYHAWSAIAAYWTGWLVPKVFTVALPQAPTIAGNQRTVSPDKLNYRTAPNTTASISKVFDPGDVLDLKGFVHGESVENNDIWFVGAYTGGYVWSGGCSDAGTHDLADLTPSKPTTPAPNTDTQIPEAVYAFSKDIDCVTEVRPAATTNFEYGNFPDKPEMAVIHDFGTKGKDTITSLINWFTKARGDGTSAHFAVSGKRIVQLVSLKDRAYHAGKIGNNYIGIETDPAQDPETIESAKSLLKELKVKYGYQFPLIEHNQIMSTSCGDDVDLANYDITLVEPEKPVEPPQNAPEEVKVTLYDVLKVLVEKIIDWLKQWRR
jgi:hypothetical protein